MSTCTFFGHRLCPDGIEPAVRSVLVDLIEKHGVNLFYVGNNGCFDYKIYRMLYTLKEEYTHIEYYIVLTCMPGALGKLEPVYAQNTIFPEEIENVPPRFAICRRNEWMIKRTDYVVTYITNTFGGAAQFAKLAVRRGKHVINIADMNT